MGLDRADRLAAIGGGSDNFDVIMRLEPQLQPLRRQRLIVDQDGANGHFVAFFLIVRWAARRAEYRS